MTRWVFWLTGLIFTCEQPYVQAQIILITKVETIQRPYTEQLPFRFHQGDSIIHVSYRNNNVLVHFDSSIPNTAFKYNIKALLPRSVITRDTFIVLPDLPNGELVLEISDAQRTYVKPARLKIVVESPLWLRWWFLPMMFLYGLVFVSACLYLLYRYRIRQFLRLQHTRDRIARDLHDDMGSYLSSISILSQTAQRSALKDPAKTQATLERIGQTARQVMDSMGDIVWSINPTHDSMTNVAARMTDVAASLFTDQPVDWHVVVDDDVKRLSLSAEHRRDFFLIYKEAITNVARYAEAHQVTVRLQRQTGDLVLTVQDDGRGFNTEQPVKRNSTGGNGLRNMQNRAVLLGGTLTVESVERKGTLIRLQFPI